MTTRVLSFRFESFEPQMRVLKELFPWLNILELVRVLRLQMRVLSRENESIARESFEASNESIEPRK